MFLNKWSISSDFEEKYPAKVFKGMRMAGQMGNQRVKVENLEVLNIDTEKNIIVVKGAVPGFNNSFILIEK